MNLQTYSKSFHDAVAEALDRIEVTGDAYIPTTCPVFLIGNGGSATVAAHICNDLIKARRPAFVPDYATLSCLANDYGWENALKAWLESTMIQPAMLIAISSSGASQNIIKAVLSCKAAITLTGFDPNNPLRSMGSVNYYVPSSNYGVVETAHLAILHGMFNSGL